MYNFLNKHGQSLAFGLGFLIVLIYVFVAFPKAIALEESLPLSLSETPVGERGDTNFFNTGLTPAIILIFITIFAMVAFGVYHVATNFKSSLKGLLGFAALVVLFFVFQATASDVPTGSIVGAIDTFTENGTEFAPGTLQTISAGISTTIVLIVAAAAAFVYSEVTSFFK